MRAVSDKAAYLLRHNIVSIRVDAGIWPCLQGQPMNNKIPHVHAGFYYCLDLICLGLIFTYGYAAAKQISIAVHIVDPSHRWPVFSGAQ